MPAGMTEQANAVVSVEEIQKGWQGLMSRVEQLEAQRALLEQENKALRHLLERVIEHRQKSHGELVLMLTNLVSKLPMNDAGGIVAQLVEHKANVSQFLAALAKVTPEAELPQMKVLKTMDQAKRDLTAALKPVAEELSALEPPLESGVLQGLAGDPELFFAPRVVRANRCFVKGFVPKERVLKEFGEPSLVFFNDVTTDPKLNPHPKTEEIALEFKGDFEALFQERGSALGAKGAELAALHRRVQRSRAASDEARAQKNAFLRLSFLLDLLHFYEHQSTEPIDLFFAKRLPGLIEQLVLPAPQAALDEKLIVQAESLLGYVVNPNYRQMILNNIGKGGGVARTLKFVLRLRGEPLPAGDPDQVISDFLRHLIPPQKLPKAEDLAAVLKLFKPDLQLWVLKTLVRWDRIPPRLAEGLAMATGAVLGISGLLDRVRAEIAESPEAERQKAWLKVRDLIAQRTDAAKVAAAIRDRLHAKYEADEIKESWVALIESDPLSLIKTFCQIPYLPDGRTDPIARTVIELHVTRLFHEKYAATYKKVVNSIKSMIAARPDNPTAHTFVALVRWVNPEAANKLCADTGMPAAA